MWPSLDSIKSLVFFGIESTRFLWVFSILSYLNHTLIIAVINFYTVVNLKQTIDICKLLRFSVGLMSGELLGQYNMVLWFSKKGFGHFFRSMAGATSHWKTPSPFGHRFFNSGIIISTNMDWYFSLFIILVTGTRGPSP